MTTGPQRRGLVIAAPSSSSGKTVVTLALLRALRNQGVAVCGAKAGPDYIDPKFHSLACGQVSRNLDPWAMDKAMLASLVSQGDSEILLVEAMMGLFDGAADGRGSAADLAAELALPVVLVVDCAKQSHSVAALIKGFTEFRQTVEISGVILNKVGSDRHESMLRGVIKPLGVPVLGAIRRHDDLCLPERHLGLVQAEEMAAVEAFVKRAAVRVAGQCDLALLIKMAAPVAESKEAKVPVRPLGQRIAIAKDIAFSFIYPHLVEGWQKAGAELTFFSPLADESPSKQCDAVYLPGGYPELHCAQLASAERFKSGMREAGKAGKVVFGECGGYMVLGDGLTDKEGFNHGMVGLLKLETSFVTRKLHLGYRKAVALGGFSNQHFACHEFHYSSVLKEEGTALFQATDALGAQIGPMGLREGRIMGSYLHIISEIQP